MDATTIIDALKPLPTSKKPLYWTDQTDDGRSCWTTQPPELMEQVARVCGAVSVAGEYLTQATFDKAAKVAKKYNLPMSVNCWPFGWSRVPKDAKQDDPSPDWLLPELMSIKSWSLRAAKMARDAGVKIGAVLVDFERWRMNTTAGFEILGKVQVLLLKAFPDSTIAWYANRQFEKTGQGWQQIDFGTWQASYTPCVNWYTLGEYAECAERHAKTRSMAPFREYMIIPWIAVGWHYKRGWVMQGDQPIPYDSHCRDSAPTWNMYKVGCELVKKDYDKSHYVGNSDVPFLVLHPGPGAHEDGDPREGMEWYRSFVPLAYGTCEGKLPKEWW